MYSEKEMESLIKATVSETGLAFLEWMRKETEIVDVETKLPIIGAEITLKPNRKFLTQDYVYPRLKVHGINFIAQDNEQTPTA